MSKQKKVEQDTIEQKDTVRTAEVPETPEQPEPQAEDKAPPSGEEMIEMSRHLRLQADFENYKRRVRQEMDQMSCYGKEQVILDILPVMDNFARALGFESDNQELIRFREGMEMIHRQLSDALKKHGLMPIDAVGTPFDPNCHEAIMQVDASCAEEDNLVLDDLQQGYTLNDKVIRPSMVKVGKY